VIVVDTNVVVQLLFGGAQRLALQKLRARDPEWSAPAILLSELRNVLVGHVRRGTITERRAVDMTEDASNLLAGRIGGVSPRETIAVALECQLSAYDAEFVVLARRLHVPLATLDRAILGGAPDVAVPPAVLAERLERSSPERFQ